MLHRTPVLSILATAALVGGCASLMPASLRPGQSADNPLHGTALTSSEKPAGLPFEGQQACTTWPIENTLAVKATEAEICVEGSVHKLMQPEFTPSAESSLAIASDGSGSSGSIHGPKGRAQKIGSCFDKTANRTQTVWVTRYNDCVPNRNQDGKQALSAASTFLEVGDARWRFPAPDPAAKTTVSSGKPR